MHLEEEKLFSVLCSVVTSVLFLCVYTEPQHSAVPLYFLPSIFGIEFSILFFIHWTNGIFTITE